MANNDFQLTINSKEGERMAQALSDLVAKEKDGKREAFKAEMKRFLALFLRFHEGGVQEIEWAKVNPPPERLLLRYETLESAVDPGGVVLNKLAVLKLNGGLGTSMGCVGPKSAIEVRGDLTFLDLTVKQIEALNRSTGASVPLLLMNSFNTDADTAKIIGKYTGLPVPILSFQQSQYPRFWKDMMLPCPGTPTDELECWYPPGHGDVYASLRASGHLDALLAQGKEWLFISNVDNLGATVDAKILAYLAAHPECEYLMELTDKTEADVKGGTVIEYEGKARLLELAQVPAAHVSDFTSIKKFRVFNTNNMWVRLDAIKRVLEHDELRMDIIVNNKVYNGQKVIQLEEAAGAAIASFRNAVGVNVPRSRFLPVKTTNDLLLVQSSVYVLDGANLVMSPHRKRGAPLIRLGPEFAKVGDYNSRLKTVPDILELDELSVAGDVVIGAGAVLKGTVTITANDGEHIDIPDGSVLENKNVTGSLRVVSRS